MWSVALAVVTCLALHRENVGRRFKDLIKFSRNSIILYLLSPLVVYAAFGIYIAVAMLLHLFDFSAYVELLTSSIRNATTTMLGADVERLAWIYALMQIPLAYIYAITINAFIALGEEIGWRGYLYKLLGSKPSLRNTAIIGAVWSLWHASATLLIGWNYYYNRFLGILLFTLLSIATTYPFLELTSLANSVLPAASLHGTINALWPLTVAASRLPPSQREVILGLGALGIATWSITSLLIAVLMKVIRLQTRKTKHNTYPHQDLNKS